MSHLIKMSKNAHNFHNPIIIQGVMLLQRGSEIKNTLHICANVVESKKESCIQFEKQQLFAHTFLQLNFAIKLDPHSLEVQILF